MALVELYFSSPPASHAGVFFGACIRILFACLKSTRVDPTRKQWSRRGGRAGRLWSIWSLSDACVHCSPPYFVARVFSAAGRGARASVVCLVCGSPRFVCVLYTRTVPGARCERLRVGASPYGQWGEMRRRCGVGGPFTTAERERERERAGEGEFAMPTGLAYILGTLCMYVNAS